MAKAKKIIKKGKRDEEEDELAGGASLDDAFADDEDVEYAPSKPKKAKKKKDEDLDEELDEAEEEVEKISKAMQGNGEKEPVQITASKPVGKIKKGDRIKIDGKDYEVDSHYVLIDHGTTKEMAIELFDKDDKDYQLRYFNDQMETTLDLYELQEILYVKRAMQKIEW